MTSENDYSRDFGEHSAFSSMLEKALRLMSAKELTELLREVNSQLEATETVNSRNPSSHLSGHIDGLKRIQFRVGQFIDIAEGSYILSEEFKMVCIKCNLPVFDFRKPCPVCESFKWFEVDHRGHPR